mgnify:CR=1 FL=1
MVKYVSTEFLWFMSPLVLNETKAEEYHPELFSRTDFHLRRDKKKLNVSDNLSKKIPGLRAAVEATQIEQKQKEECLSKEIN